FVDEVRQEIERRLGQLEPLVVEYRRLEAGQAALEKIRESTGRKPAAVKRPASRTARATPASKHRAARRMARRQATSRRKVSKKRGPLPGDPGGNPPPSFVMTGDPGGNPRPRATRKAR